MLSGERAFKGNTVTDTLTRVLEHEPDWAALPNETPPVLRTLLTRCLRKDPKKRLRDIGDVLIEIEDASAVTTDASGGKTNAPARRVSRERVAWILAAAFLCLAATAFVWNFRAKRPDSVDLVQFTIVPPGSSGNPFNDQFEISPDGRQVAFIATVDRKRMVWVRSLDTPEPHALAGTESVTRLFWKPDGSALGFIAGGEVKTIRLADQQPVRLCDGLGKETGMETTLLCSAGKSGRWAARHSSG